MPQDLTMQIGKYTITIQQSGCISAASCVAISPQVFKLDDDNLAVFCEGATDEEQNILMAAQSCPTKCIIVTETESGNQVWPTA
jgi:ferredoxin